MNIKRYVPLFLVGMLVAMASACKDKVIQCPTCTEPLTVSIQPGTAAITVGEAVNLAVIQSLPGGTKDWTSSNPAVATVISTSEQVARVVGISAGTATITVKVSCQGQMKEATATITVRPGDAPVITFAIAPKSASIYVGDPIQMSVLSSQAPTSISWLSTAPNVAIVDQSGRVTGVSSGTARIVATAFFGSQSRSDTATVVVQNRPTSGVGIVVAPGSVTCQPGQTTQASAAVSAPGGTSTAVTWRSRNNAIATVSQSGLIMCISQGQTIFDAIAQADTTKQAQITVQVNAPPIVTPIRIVATPQNLTLQVGQSQTVNAVVTGPQGVNTAVFWQSTSIAVATVGANGTSTMVTGISAGTAMIIAVAVADNTVRDTIFVTVTAPPQQQAPVVTITASTTLIQGSGQVVISWSATNATSCTATANPSNANWTGSKAVSGSQTIFVSSTTTFTVTCTGPGGTSSNSVTVTVSSAPPQAPIVSISASTTSIQGSGQVIITWSSNNTTSCTVTANPSNANWTGSRATSGSQAISLTTTTTFTVTCTGPGGTSSNSVTVTVTTAPPPVQAPVVTFTLTPSSGFPGSTTTINWSATNATSCTASSSPQYAFWNGPKGTSGSQVISNIASTSQFTIVCTGPGGSSSPITLTYTVTAPPPTGNGFITGIQISPTQVNLPIGSEFTFTVTVSGASNADKTFTCAPTSNTTEYLQVVAVTATTCRVKALKLYVPGVTPRPIIVVRTVGRNSGGFQLEAGAFVDTKNP